MQTVALPGRVVLATLRRVVMAGSIETVLPIFPSEVSAQRVSAVAEHGCEVEAAAIVFGDRSVEIKDDAGERHGVILAQG